MSKKKIRPERLIWYEYSLDACGRWRECWMTFRHNSNKVMRHTPKVFGRINI
jgi:hypothetical protein